MTFIDQITYSKVNVRLPQEIQLRFAVGPLREGFLPCVSKLVSETRAHAGQFAEILINELSRFPFI